jgi:outer membrane lipoprotein carrier protein
MKKLSLILIVILISAGFAHAQYDDKALAILDAMSARYKSMPAFKAEFTYALENAANKVNENLKGEITVKGDKFRLKTDGQEIYNNGTTVWTYLTEENEVNISDYEPNEDEITPSKIYTIYKKGYKYAFLEEKKEGNLVYEIVELVPEKKDKQIFKIRIQVNKKDKSIKNWKIFEKSGNKLSYTITKFTPNVTVEDKFFEFDKTKYKGVEVVDLR